MRPFPRRGALALLSFVWLALAAPAAAQESFFAPAEPAGGLEVRLHPTEGVAPGTARLVTFGVPFPRGSLTPAGLATVRVLSGGAEIPAHVDLLAAWRHLTDAALDGAWVRVARVQIHHTFAVAHPGYETVTVAWGGPARALDVPVLVDPRTGWHPVADGAFLAADGVAEPDVYAVLPKAHLVKGLLKPTRMEPFADDSAEGRDSPAAMDAVDHWPGYQEAERAAKNNFYSLINEDDPAVTAANRCPFRTDYEPWLYDRASSMFVLYFRSGFRKALREAVRNAELYRKHVAATGFFDLKPGDPKYAYNECLAYLRWLTGDDAALTQIAQVVSAHSGTAHKWSPTTGFWTERNSGFKLLANAVAFETTGSATLKAATAAILADLKWHQDGAGGALPAGRVDGGLYHYGAQHDGDWADGALGASPWMTVLVADAALRAYALDPAASTAHFLRRLGNFAKAAVAPSTDPLYDGATAPLDKPHYALLADGSVGASEYGDEEHALEVAGLLAWAGWFAESLGVPDPTLKGKAVSLYATYDLGVNHWIRPAGPASGLTAYRVAPWRKYGWEHRPSASLSWVMKPAAGGPPPNVSPSVAITAPAPGAVLASGAPIPVSAAASDVDGTVTKVEFFADGGKAGEDATAPFSFALPALPAGAHVLTAVATDDDGATTVSAPVSITVAAPANLPPAVALTAPAPGAAFPYGSSIVLTASAADSDGTVGKVEFFRDGVEIGEDLSAPWTVEWTGAAAGAHVLAARATDDDGATTDSAPVAIEVTAPANLPPTVTLTSPASGSTVAAPATVTLSADAGDSDGTIAKVDFYSGATLVASDSTAPYSITLSSLPAGSYAFSATATDDDGASTASAAATVTVTASGDGGGGTPVTAVYRQGRYGYAGADDVTISTQYAEYTGGEGTTYPTGDLGCFAVSGAAGYEKRALLRFGALGLPVGTKVKSAKLTLRVVTWAKGFAVHGHYLKAAWSTTGGWPGWLHRAAGLAWAVPGAGGAGTDRIAGKGFSLSGFKGSGEQSMTVTLDPAVVQGWVDDPAANQGVLLVNGSADKVLHVRSAEYATKTRRPTLTIVYEPAAGGAAPPAPATATASFRTGEGGYAGTKDAAVSTLYIDEPWNGGHGATFPTGDMPCYEVSGPGGYKAHAWLRFDGLTIPAGAKVKSAALTLAVDTWDAGFTIRGRYVARAWNPAGITWLRADLGLPWTVPGGTGEGSDVAAGKSFALSGFTASGLDVKTVALDPAVVQSWVDHPGENQGVLLVNESADKIARIRSSEASTVAQRPRLTITYDP